MNHRGERAEINQTVQHLPTFASESPDPARSGRDRQRNQQHEGKKSNCNVLALYDVREDLMNIKELIHPEIRREVQTSVKKGKQPKHSTKFDQRRHPQQLSHWSDGQSNEQKTQSPIPGAVF